jgi:tRNA uridine 5-carboxymethylaminomethyl modification enzyme
LASRAVTARRTAQIEEHFAERETACWADSDEGRADTLYAPYVERQKREWEVVRRDSSAWIPPAFDLRSVAGLSNEMVERLEQARPETLDQASRVPGITPAALSALFVAVNRRAAA